MIESTDLGLLAYRQAWAIQQDLHQQVLAGAPPRLLVVEHPPVITYGRRPGQNVHLLADPQSLASLGVEVVQSDRGGDVTFHGPGQLVVYPILRLADFGLSVSGYVRLLEGSVINALAEFSIPAQRVEGLVGAWTPLTDGPLAKISAIGVRISRGVSLHGLALNVTTDLRYFNLIVPCGIVGRSVTSVSSVLGEKSPTMEQVKQRVLDSLRHRLEESRSHAATADLANPTPRADAGDRRSDAGDAR